MRQFSVHYYCFFFFFFKVNFQDHRTMYFPSGFCCFPENFGGVPDRVGAEVFLAGAVTLLQCIHASLACSYCCFLKRAFRLLPAHPG